MLRDYVYLDRNRVEDYLSQLEGGVSDSTRETETDLVAEVDGGLNLGIAKIGSKITAPALSQEELRRTTDVALFERLYSHLEHGRDMTRINEPDDLDIRLIRQGDLIELECDVVVAGTAKLSHLARDMQALAPLMGESIEGAEQIGALFGGDFPVRFMLGGKVVAHSTLGREGIRADISEMEGEYTALARVRKIVKAGTRVPLRKFAGIKLSVAQIEELFARMDLNTVPPELDLNLSVADVVADGPSLVVTVVAVYR